MDELDLDDEDNIQQIINQKVYHPIDRIQLDKLIIDLINSGIRNLNCIDVSKITDFSFLFLNRDMKDIDISMWNVSNGIDFSGMFYGTTNFQSDLSNWNVTNGMFFGGMFYDCLTPYYLHIFEEKIPVQRYDNTWNKTEKHNKLLYYLQAKHVPRDKVELLQVISDYKRDKVINYNDIDVSKITDFDCIFAQSAITKIDIRYWNVSNGKSFRNMFYNCSWLEADLSLWDVSNGECFFGMFQYCGHFNSDLSQWDVGKGIEFNNMFFGCIKFDCDLSQWDVSSGQTFEHMFKSCHQFNCDLSQWNMENARNIDEMFTYCTNVDFDLSRWDLKNVQSADDILYGVQHIKYKNRIKKTLESKYNITVIYEEKY